MLDKGRGGTVILSVEMKKIEESEKKIKMKRKL